MSPTGCDRCRFYNVCGGMGDTFDFLGCSFGSHAQCTARGWTCFCNPHLFADRYSEVGGFEAALQCRLVVPTASFPYYIPTIYHSGSRNKLLPIEWAALPLDCVIRKRRDGRFRATASDGESLRKAFGLASSTKIIVTSVRPDPVIEQFWRHHRIADAPSILAELDIQAITVPNYSFFDDCPRPHILYNWSRMLRVAERLSAAGLGTILHLNALTRPDWDRWERILRDQSDITVIAKEFQTGLRNRVRGDQAYAELIRLQERLGRHLHPILFAGRRFLPSLDRNFPAGSTVIDATPFLRTYFRRGLEHTRNSDLKWKVRKTAKGLLLDTKLAQVLQDYQNKLLQLRAPQRELALKLQQLQPPKKPVITLVGDLPLFATRRASPSAQDSGVPRPPVRNAPSIRRHRNSDDVSSARQGVPKPLAAASHPS